MATQQSTRRHLRAADETASPVAGQGSSAVDKAIAQAETPLGRRTSGVQLRARRNPRMIALGVLMACLGGLGGAFFFHSATHSQQVLVMAHTVPRGALVTSGDLRIATVTVDSAVATIPSSEIDSVVGKTALVDLTEGSLPSTQSVGQLVVPTDSVTMGIRVDAGHLPEELTAGTAIDLVPVAAASSSGTSTLGGVVQGLVVTAPSMSAAGDSYTLDIAVSPKDEVTVARLAAAGQLYVVRKSHR